MLGRESIEIFEDDLIIESIVLSSDSTSDTSDYTSHKKLDLYEIKEPLTTTLPSSPHKFSIPRISPILKRKKVVLSPDDLDSTSDTSGYTSHKKLDLYEIKEPLGTTLPSSPHKYSIQRIPPILKREKRTRKRRRFKQSIVLSPDDLDSTSDTSGYTSHKKLDLYEIKEPLTTTLPSSRHKYSIPRIYPLLKRKKIVLSPDDLDSTSDTSGYTSHKKLDLYEIKEPLTTTLPSSRHKYSIPRIYPLLKRKKSFVSHSFEDNVRGPDEVDIFNKILNNGTDASMFIWNYDITSQFEDSEEAESWIQHHSKTFRMSTTRDGDRLIHLCLENAMPCYDYWSKNGCQKEECTMFHICKKYLFEVMHSGISCKYNHDIYQLSRSELAANYNLQSISPEHLMILLKTRFPTVCVKYLQGHCQLADLCPNVHICGEFIEGRCKKADGLCSYKHESGLTTKHTVSIMSGFHISVENYQKCIIYDDNFPMSHNKMITVKELEVDFDSLRDEAICHLFLTDSCKEGSSCNLIHTDPKSPYLWQYRKGSVWENFNHNINMSIEECYSQPENESFHDILRRRLVVHFSKINQIWKGNYVDDEIEVRRLSTKSSANAADMEIVAGFTEWKWYWESGDYWEEYCGSICSEGIEKSFLDKTKSEQKFKANVYQYSLNFKNMEQQNLGPLYFTKRRVRRRPVFKDINDIINPVSYHQILPSHWPKRFQDGNRISIVNKEIEFKIKTKFMNAIRKRIKILSVTEVCNRVLYKKYMHTRQLLIDKLGEGNINEMMLYHGTTSDVVQKICIQNFDWRMNGRNATVYGCGSYFAKDASYSDTFAIPNNDEEQHVFLAQVLVGKYTKGDASMKRPPEDVTQNAPGILYDSCVNEAANPSIFIIFGQDQCIPKYLIKYRKEKA